ncbi:hypothetical protein CMI41_04065 [Candidatus Pacearchaeota archaeon]|nr:hypothetical protein [Candidatus Pacearchaeota archaeon]|tara:strand:+ start:4764 stop:8306 length:3543 start_codon:yes stop_codon:yes gene_type:complete
MSHRSKVRALAKIALRERKVRRRQTNKEKELKEVRLKHAEEGVEKSFSEAQIDFLFDLSEKYPWFQDDYSAYVSLAKNPKLFDVAVKAIGRASSGELYGPRVLSRFLGKIAHRTSMNGLEMDVSSLEACVGLEEHFLENCKTREANDRKRKAPNWYTPSLGRFTDFLVEGESVDGRRRLLALGEKFHQEVSKELIPKLPNPLYHFIKNAYGALSTSERLAGSEGREKIYSWMSSFLESKHKKEVLGITSRVPLVLEKRHEEFPRSFEKWRAEIEDLLVMKKSRGRDNLMDYLTKAVTGDGDVPGIELSNLGTFSNLLKKINSQPGSLDRKRKELARFNLSAGGARKLGQGKETRLLNILEKFRNSEMGSNRCGVGTYAENTMQALEIARSKEYGADGAEFVWEKLENFPESPRLKEAALDLSGDLKIALGVGPTLQKAQEYIGALESLIEAGGYEGLRGFEERFLITLKKCQEGTFRINETIKPDEESGGLMGAKDYVELFNFARMVPTGKGTPLASNSKTLAFFEKLLYRYAAMPEHQREFAVNMARDFFEDTKHLAEAASLDKEVIENRVKAYKEATISLIDRTPELFKMGHRDLRSWFGKMGSESQSPSSLVELVVDSNPADLTEVAEREVNLGEIRGVMNEYAHALCREPLEIRGIDMGAPTIPMTDGKTIRLPSRVSLFKDKEANSKFYKVLTSYQCGMIEFGTFDFNTEDVERKLPDLELKEADTIKDVLAAFPNPELASRVFYLSELARVGSRLRETYPGLVNYMDEANNVFLMSESKERSPLLKALLHHSLAKKTSLTLEEELETTYEKATKELDTLGAPDARVEDSLRATYNISSMLEGAEIEDDPTIKKESEITERIKLSSGPKEEPIEEMEATAEGAKYHEWDHDGGKYNGDFVTVVEKEAQEGSRKFIDGLYSDKEGTIKRVREHFRRIKPREVTKVKRRHSGELDYAAAVQAKADQKAGKTPSEKLYYRTYKNKRSVATALLGDISGSSGDFIGDSSARPLDILRETILYYSLGLEELKDPYAVFLYSGHGKDNVNFFNLKDFQEQFSPATERRISSLRPQESNRDGAAIRHTTELLRRQPYKNRLLLYVTDFNPKDEGYDGEYAIQDTRMALREARLKGIQPCVMVTRELKSEKDKDLVKGIRHVVVPNSERLPSAVQDVYLKLTR